MLVKVLAPLALASSVVLGSAAPPNPDKLFALQEKAAAAAGVTATKHSTALASESSSASSSHDEVRRGIDWKNGLKGQARAQFHPAGGMKRHVKRSGHDQLIHHHLERRQNSLDSSVAAKDDSDLEARATQYTLNNYDNTNKGDGNGKQTATASAAKSKETSYSGDNSGPSVSGYWTGVSSYYLYAMADQERIEVLDAVKNAGFKVIRIFVAYVGHNNKGSNSYEVPDLEPNEVGSYDDTVLYKIDQLMYECKQRGLKLLIALSDRYALGYWSTDRYALQLNIVKAGTNGVQKVANAASFYTNPWAIKMFEQRLTHAMNHKNDKLGGRTWAELDDVVYAYEPQNEPQGHMPMAAESWSCDRAKLLKSLLKGSIKVSSGGGITTTDSLGPWAMNCDYFDVVSVHDYGTSGYNTANALADAQSRTKKEVIMGEWGIAGPNKAQIIGEFVQAFKSKGLPWMYWQITKPGQCSLDFEVWTDEPAWTALTGQPATGNSCQYKTPTVEVKPTSTAQWAQTTQSWALPSKDDSKKDDWKPTTQEWKPTTQEWKPTTDKKQEWTPTASATQSKETWKDDKKDDDKKDDWKNDDDKKDSDNKQNDWKKDDGKKNDGGN